MVKQTIEILDKETIDQIAAGEVVERPASVVKELVENAVDAHATAITVEIRDGGKRLIRVTDNGDGIPADQIRRAFLRHATSKIRHADDLVQIRSLGFRGEALSSIAAVAQVECITKTKEALTGVQYRLEGGTEDSFEEIGAPDGTTMIVRNLFFNTPVREKFLKSAASEGSQVRTFTESLALSHPHIAFTFIHDGRVSLATDGRGDICAVLYQIYGRELPKNLIPFRTCEEGTEITGYLGNAVCARGNRAGELFYVNGRMVKNDLLSKAVEDGYHGFLMQHRYPFVLLYLHLDGTQVDVNVHPTKKEVRFTDGEPLYRMLCLAVQNTLLSREHIPEVPVTKEEKEARSVVSGTSAPEPFEQVRRAKELHDTAVPYAASAAPVSRPAAEPGENEELLHKDAESGQKEVLPHRDAALEPSPASTAPGESISARNVKTGIQQTLSDVSPVFSEQARRSYRLIGQVFDTYWLMEYRDELYIVDQHAAHEKILYEKLMKQFRTRTITTQMLYPSVILEPGPREADLLRSRISVLQELGFEIEEFGGDTFKMTGVPANLFKTDVHAVFLDILDQMKELGDVPAESLAERLASMSCKAAVKGNRSLSFAEAETLFDELLLLENPYHCPHGRPTIIRMSKGELDRKFKRIL
ncbi:MAG: DNA mismatch repair endonuclease MutL [Eubacterium sp.]|nr:DNA mismatch repair endonuclease MutL [Eubacterium sp.]